MTRNYSILLLLASTLYAAQGPVHKSLRAYAMGNAFVAVAEDKDAVYYNPAGLNLINRLGNYEKYPELGYYPNNFIDARISTGVNLPVSQGYQAYKLGMDAAHVYKNATRDPNAGQSVILDTVGNHPELSDKLMAFDQRTFPVGVKQDFEFAVPHFGGSIWLDATVSPYLETGIITPGVGIDTAYVDAVAQAAIGFGIGERWSVGIGYKGVKREYMPRMKTSLLEFQSAIDTIKSESDLIKSDVSKVSTVGHAIELGGMYQWKREVRLGASLRNLFIVPMGEESITPNLTTGIVYSPRRLQRNTGFYRKVNFAADYEDIFNNDRNYKFFSHLNIGMECDQVLLGIPNYPSIRFLKARGGVGFKGGYPTAGFALEVMRFVEVEATTWAEELGYYTGAVENRYWVVQASIGI